MTTPSIPIPESQREKALELVRAINKSVDLRREEHPFECQVRIAEAALQSAFDAGREAGRKEGKIEGLDAAGEMFSQNGMRAFVMVMKEVARLRSEGSRE